MRIYHFLEVHQHDIGDCFGEAGCVHGIGGVTFEIFLEGEMVMRVTVDRRLQGADVKDCLRTLDIGLEVAEKEGFSDSGVFNWEINGRRLQICYSG